VEELDSLNRTETLMLSWWKRVVIG